jgi:hypothetical protein
MRIALALLTWLAVVVGGWMIWMVGQLYHVRPGLFGAEGLAVVLAIWMTLEARRCG